MKNIKLKLLSLIIIAITASACSLFKNSAPIYAVDPVCHMKVDKSEAYTWTYKGVEYYFDSVNCKEVFKMDPENILNKNSSEPKK